MAASNLDSGIRVFSLFRRIGSVITVGVICLLLGMNIVDNFGERGRLSDLEDIAENGVSKRAEIDERVQMKYVDGRQQLTFQYSFTEGDQTYRSEYTLYGNLPTDDATAVFTVHYLKDDPEESSLNIQLKLKG